MVNPHENQLSDQTQVCPKPDRSDNNGQYLKIV